MRSIRKAIHAATGQYPHPARQLGGQIVERDGFEAALSNFGEVSLFHKADLANGSIKVLKEIAGGKRVVGVVVNAIDDLLSDGDQVRIAWSLDSIAHVRTLLLAAADAERMQDGKPVVIFRQNRRQWTIALSLADFIALQGGALHG